MSNFAEVFEGFNFDAAMAERIKGKLGSELTVEGLRQSVVGLTRVEASRSYGRALAASTSRPVDRSLPA